MKLGETAVRMNRLMGGGFTSKRLCYAPPPPEQIEELRAHYGAAIYPTVQAPARVPKSLKHAVAALPVR